MLQLPAGRVNLSLRDVSPGRVVLSGLTDCGFSHTGARCIDASPSRGWRDSGSQEALSPPVGAAGFREGNPPALPQRNEMKWLISSRPMTSCTCRGGSAVSWKPGALERGRNGLVQGPFPKLWCSCFPLQLTVTSCIPDTLRVLLRGIATTATLASIIGDCLNASLFVRIHTASFALARDPPGPTQPNDSHGDDPNTGKRRENP